MISFDPPYRVIDGYTLLKDHADPNLYYALPPAPSLGMRPGGRPDFSLLQYLGGGAGAKKVSGGLLTFTTELGVPEDVLDRLASRLKDSDAPGGEAPGGVRVMPVLYDSGQVELIALGAASPSPAGEGEAADPGPDSPFSVTFLGSMKPSLGGTNGCTFQLILDELAAELVAKALETPDIPIIAIYRMGLVGLRPSFQVDVQADWQKVYRSLQNKASANVWVVAADADIMISKTLEESGIVIDTSVFGAGPGEQAAAERARKQLVDWVLEHLFEPLTDPSAAMANSIGRVVEDTVWSLARTVLPGVAYKLRILNDDQLRTLSARMKEAIAERREVVPQGTLGGMFHRFRVNEQGDPRPDWDAISSELVTTVNLDGFPRLEVTVAVEDRFASDGLSEVQVELARPGPGDDHLGAGGERTDIERLVFRSAAEREVYLVNLLGKAPGTAAPAQLADPYLYRTLVEFDPAGPFGPQAALQTEWEHGNAAELFVEPRQAYLVRTVKVAATPLFSFDPFAAVTVELRYAGESGGISQVGQVRLTAAAPEATWLYRSLGILPRAYEYRVTYHRPVQAGGEIILDWQPAVDEWLSIPDPMPVKRTLNLFFSLPWEALILAFLQVRYNDPEHGIHFDEQIDLNPQMQFVRRDYPIAEGGLRTLEYRLTALLKNGQLQEGAWRSTEDDRLLVDRRLIDARPVRVQAVGGGLAENKLASVKLRLQTRDPGTGLERASSETMLLPGKEADPFSWEYLLGNPPASGFFYQAIFIDRDGFVTTVPWTASTAAILVINLRLKTVSGA